MARVLLTSHDITVRFSLAERILGFLRDITIPRSAVTSVSVEPEALQAVGGLRAPGFALPWRRKIGTWRGFGDQPRRTAVSVRAGEPAVRILVAGARWDQLIIGIPEATTIAATLAEQLTGQDAGTTA